MKRLHIMLHLLETELHDIRSFSVFHNVIAKPALIIFILLGMFKITKWLELFLVESLILGVRFS